MSDEVLQSESLPYVADDKNLYRFVYRYMSNMNITLLDTKQIVQKITDFCNLYFEKKSKRELLWDAEAMLIMRYVLKYCLEVGFENLNALVLFDHASIFPHTIAAALNYFSPSNTTAFYCVDEKAEAGEAPADVKFFSTRLPGLEHLRLLPNCAFDIIVVYFGREKDIPLSSFRHLLKARRPHGMVLANLTSIDSDLESDQNDALEAAFYETSVFIENTGFWKNEMSFEVLKKLNAILDPNRRIREQTLELTSFGKELLSFYSAPPDDPRLVQADCEIRIKQCDTIWKALDAQECSVEKRHIKFALHRLKSEFVSLSTAIEFGDDAHAQTLLTLTLPNCILTFIAETEGLTLLLEY